MSGSELYADRHRVHVHHEPPSPPIDRFTWQCDPLDGPVNLGILRRLIEQMEADGVPADADIQMSWPRVYAHWYRHVR